MIQFWLGLLLWLLASSSASADLVMGSAKPGTPSACSVSFTQNFASDPIGINATAYTQSANCPVFWDGTGVKRERTGGSCPASFGLLRFDTPVGALAGCMSAKLVGFTGWGRGPGLIFWANAGDPSTSWYALWCDDGTACTHLRTGDHTGSAQEISTTFGSVDVGDYLGVCWEDTPGMASMRVEAWNFGTTAPAALPTDWGAPTAVGTSDPFGSAGDGQLTGLYMRALNPAAASSIVYDDVSVWRGCETAGGDSGTGSLNAWTAGNVWSTSNFWL